MLQSLLQALPEGGKTAKIGDVSLFALLGFIVVFIGIAFLIFIVWLVGKILNKAQTKTKKATTVSIRQDISPVDAALNNDEITDETVAVITAALMAYYEKNNPKCEFTVKRIKRI